MRVWIDQDLCTGDGLCVDACPEVFTLLDDGIAYVRDEHGPLNDPGGPESLATVPTHAETRAVEAAVLCPGECIFLELDDANGVDGAARRLSPAA